MSCTTGKGRFWRLSRLIKVWPMLRALGMGFLFHLDRFSCFSGVELFSLTILVCAELTRHKDTIWCNRWLQDSAFLFYTHWRVRLGTGPTAVSGALGHPTAVSGPSLPSLDEPGHCSGTRYHDPSPLQGLAPQQDFMSWRRNGESYQQHEVG